MKCEPTALAAGVENYRNHITTPEASAYGSRFSGQFDSMNHQSRIRRLFARDMPLARRVGLFVGLVVAGIKQVVDFVFGPHGNRVYARLAERYRGKATPGSWGAAPSVTFHFNATHVTVSTDVSRLDGSSKATFVRFDWPDPGLYCDVVANLAVTNPGETSRDPPCVVRVSSNDEYAKEAFLTLREQLTKLAALGVVHVLIEHGLLHVSVSRKLRTVRQLFDFVGLSLQLYSQALLAADAGIHVIAPEESTNFGEIICNVCGEEMIANIVYCRRCHTPHHRECWKYNGECSTYGCGSAKYTRELSKESDVYDV